MTTAATVVAGGGAAGTGRTAAIAGNRHHRALRVGANRPEDDVLVPARGILDVLDNYAFVRTEGYLPGNDDAYVSLSMVKKFGLR